MTDTPHSDLNQWDAGWVQAAQNRTFELVDARWVSCHHCGIGGWNPAPDALCHRCQHPIDGRPLTSPKEQA